MKAHYDGLTCRQKKIITDVAVRTATRLADYVFYQHLQDHGVHVKKTAEVDFSPLQPSKGKGSSAPKAPKKQTEEQKK